MSLDLVVARCGRSPLLMGDTEMLSDSDREALLDRTSSDGECALALRLSGGRMAIGRRSGARCAWWVGDAFPADPPHTLWCERGLFTSDGEAQVPTAPAPDELVATLAAVEGIARAAKAVAGAVRTLRATDQPVCIVASAPQAALEALALTLVAVLGADISVAVGHPEPDASRFRLAIGPTVYDGYEPLLAADPPDEGDDLVAWYARDRLRSDPAALFVPGGVTEEHVRQVLQDGALEGTSGREGRVRALVARIRAGAEVDAALTAELIDLTEKYGDARPWVALQRRPSVVRRIAVSAALARAHRLRPTEPLLEAFSTVYPRGAPLAPWCVALLDWVRRARFPQPFIAALERALDEWPQSATRANRVSVWTELVQILVERGRFRDAQAAITGRMGELFVREGSGGALATLWGTLPSDQRNPRRLGGLIEMLVKHPDGDRAAAHLLRHVKENAAEVELLVKIWVGQRGSRGIDESDAVFKAVAHSDHFRRWLEVAMEVHPPASIIPVLARVARGPEDPLWLDAEAVLAEHTPAERRFHNLSAFSSGLVALEPLARGLIEEALRTARFPDPQVAEAARLLVDVPGSTPVWPWVAVSAAQPGRFDDDTLDGTVVEICTRPPNNGIERQLCERCAELLGGAAAWGALDHARWFVRLALAPDGDQTGFRDALLASFVSGLVTRFDAGPHVAGITLELLELPEDHEALLAFLGRWLPEAWQGRVPRAYIESVEARGVPESVQPLWAALVS